MVGVGVNIAVEKIIKVILETERQKGLLFPTDGRIDVLVTSMQPQTEEKSENTPSLLKERISLTALLWESGIKADYRLNENVDSFNGKPMVLVDKDTQKTGNILFCQSGSTNSIGEVVNIKDLPQHLRSLEQKNRGSGQKSGQKSAKTTISNNNNNNNNTTTLNNVNNSNLTITILSSLPPKSQKRRKLYQQAVMKVSAILISKSKIEVIVTTELKMFLIREIIRLLLRGETLKKLTDQNPNDLRAIQQLSQTLTDLASKKVPLIFVYSADEDMYMIIEEPEKNIQMPQDRDDKKLPSSSRTVGSRAKSNAK